MKVLIACEESQRVCTAFRNKGHDAFSCDLLECSGGHPEWHIQQDVLPLLNGYITFETVNGDEHIINGKWDMIIAFPPCTYTTNAGARHLYKNGELNIPRYYKGLCGKALFTTIRAADCDKIAIENPTPSRIFNFPQPSQVIQPYEYGHTTSKRTLLWLKGLPLLKPTKIVEPIETCHEGYSWYTAGGADRQRERAKTFLGIANAMAEQWGNL